MDLSKLSRRGLVSLRLGPIDRSQADFHGYQSHRRDLFVVGFLVGLASIFIYIFDKHLLTHIYTLLENKDSVFELGSLIFLSCFSLGWAAGVLWLIGFALLILIGGQTLMVKRGFVELVIGIPWVGLRVRYPIEDIIKVELKQHKRPSLFPLRGEYLSLQPSFDEEVVFGSRMINWDLIDLQEAIEKNEKFAKAKKLRRSLRARRSRIRKNTTSVNTSPSLISLVIANGLAALILLLDETNAGTFLLLYWAETLIIGGYLWLRYIVVYGLWGAVKGMRILLHTISYMAIYLIHIWALFSSNLPIGASHESIFSISALYQFIATLSIPIMLLVISHGISFFVHFYIPFQNGALSERSVSDSSLLSRIALLFVGVIAAGFISLMYPGMLTLLLLIVVKILMDGISHVRYHRRQNHN